MNLEVTVKAGNESYGKEVSTLESESFEESEKKFSELEVTRAQLQRENRKATRLLCVRKKKLPRKRTVHDLSTIKNISVRKKVISLTT